MPLRKVVAHLIITLDGVVGFDAVADSIMKLRDTPEVLGDFFPSARLFFTRLYFDPPVGYLRRLCAHVTAVASRPHSASWSLSRP